MSGERCRAGEGIVAACHYPLSHIQHTIYQPYPLLRCITEILDCPQPRQQLLRHLTAIPLLADGWCGFLNLRPTHYLLTSLSPMCAALPFHLPATEALMPTSPPYPSPSCPLSSPQAPSPPLPALPSPLLPALPLSPRPPISSPVKAAPRQW